ncbi:hypothetical protein ACIP2X_05675 [Streptomyces sp. NPDC089424]|uniref:hypothetical protein n=1 Tax=Streptomyces sp. NPDC089424 TaxID=3365917 RepID=UPI003830AE14
MRSGRERPVRELIATLLLAGVTTACWAAWLGWDQHRDVHPDGSTTGPYEAWQVVGLGLTLLGLVCWAAFRGHIVPAVLGTTAGLGVAAFVDWSDDTSGLFVIGVGMVVIGTFVASTLVALLIAATRPKTSV